MNITIQATITKILELQKRDKFDRQDVEVTTIEKKPQILRFEFYNENIEKINAMGEGQAVEIEFSIRGNKSKDNKVFNNLVAHDVTRLSRNEY